MKIQVNGYTYDAGNANVAVGDTVILPTASWLRDVKGPTWEGKVTALGSDYDGYCERIKGVKKADHD